MKELYENSIEAFTFLLTDLEKIEITLQRKVIIEGDDKDQLLVNLLSELIFYYDVDRFLCKEGNITDINPNKLKVTLKGEIFDEVKHEIKTEIKAVTYHELNIREEKGYFHTKIVFDL